MVVSEIALTNIERWRILTRHKKEIHTNFTFRIGHNYSKLDIIA